MSNEKILALRGALTRRPAAQTERDTGPRVLREVFALCEDTVDKMTAESTEFSRGRAFEAKGISRAIGTWFQDEFCGRSHMGEPVIQPAAQAEAHPLASRCYTMSEPHLSGHRLVLGFETLEAVDAAQTWVANINKGTQQATPEPVGEPYGWAVTGCHSLYRGEWAEATARGEAKRCGGTARAVALYTRPAPGVPEDVLAILDECRNALMECDRDGDYALIDRIDALAAAQANGGE